MEDGHKQINHNSRDGYKIAGLLNHMISSNNLRVPVHYSVERQEQHGVHQCFIEILQQAIYYFFIAPNQQFLILVTTPSARFDGVVGQTEQKRKETEPKAYVDCRPAEHVAIELEIAKIAIALLNIHGW